MFPRNHPPRLEVQPSGGHLLASSSTLTMSKEPKRSSAKSNPRVQSGGLLMANESSLVIDRVGHRQNSRTRRAGGTDERQGGREAVGLVRIPGDCVGGRLRCR